MFRVVAGAVLANLLAIADTSHAQNGEHPTTAAESVMVAAGKHYDAGPFKRSMLGDTYRDLWTTPIKVPVLDLKSFAGGLTPTEVGTGQSTRSLRFTNPDGREYVFRMVDKYRVSTPPALVGTLVDRIFRDQVSALHPGAALISAPIMHAAKTLHPTPSLAVMPDSPLLGQFRREFAGTLGMIEEYPNVPPDAIGFAGAIEIVDSGELLERINSDPMQRVDAHAMLRARLIDILLSDNDRHPGQWMWARQSKGQPVRWTPVPRDRDHALINFDGKIIRLARTLAAPTLILFEGSQINLAALTEHRGFDARLLADLNRAQWDSVATGLTRAVSDSVIDAAFNNQPPEYREARPALAAELRQRRDSIIRIARQWYAGMAVSPEIHGTDAVDRATVTRVDERFVDVHLEDSRSVRYFTRRFDASETKEIRVFLHGGDDSAVIRGVTTASILVRIIGGNGNNTLVDSSRTTDGVNYTRFYDEGQTEEVDYGADTLFNRKPVMKVNGRYQTPPPDRGVRWVPRVGLDRHSIFGTTPSVGLSRFDYGFRQYPYATLFQADVEYATALPGWRINLEGDWRKENSRLHLMATARMSDMEIVNYRGLGNRLTPEIASREYYQARQQQWLFRPAVGFAFRPASDIRFGPVLQHSISDSVPNRLISAVRPYGFGAFTQLGARLSLQLNMSAGVLPPDGPGEYPQQYFRPRHRFVFDMEATHYPALFDVRTPFQSYSARAGALFTLSLPWPTELVLRGGGKLVTGEFPFHEAAYIGGRNAGRALDFQSFEGDASLFGSAELRVRAARFVFMLPIDAGPILVGDASRIYVDGTTPGGWHASAGGGLWFGIRESPIILTFTYMNDGGTSRFGMKSGLRIR